MTYYERISNRWSIALISYGCRKQTIFVAARDKIIHKLNPDQQKMDSKIGKLGTQVMTYIAFLFSLVKHTGPVPI
jgi:hypothetical protein